MDYTTREQKKVFTWYGKFIGTSRSNRAGSVQHISRSGIWFVTNFRSLHYEQ